jgi:pimeloyl-ACP methyl ester carboxylesterase
MPAAFPDSLHPSAPGQTILAKRLYEVVTNKTDNAFDIFKKIKEPITVSSYYGYECADFNFNGRKARIVKPRRAAAGRPWIWRARFWGVEPQTEIALLDRGFHVVYCDVAELFGNTEAIDTWNKFYGLLQKAGLSKRACMEGFSRGGLYVYNWAVQNPAKVACVYVDAPVLDVKSWPGGKGKSPGSAADWAIFKKDYGFTTDEQALAFKGNPLDKVAQIVRGGYPMLHVVGDADSLVPVSENTAVFEKQVLALNGNITVIHKPGVNHHPHSLANPAPIVDFILNATGKRTVFAVTSAPGL